MRRAVGTLARGLLAGGLSLGFAASAQAQYFGRLPVQWERLEFEILATEHFDIHYYPEE